MQSGISQADLMSLTLKEVCVNNFSATDKSLKIQSFHPPVVTPSCQSKQSMYSDIIIPRIRIITDRGNRTVPVELDEAKPVTVRLNSNRDHVKMACLKFMLIWMPSIKACSPKDISKLICKSTIFNTSWEKCQWVLSSRIIRGFLSILISVRLTFIIGTGYFKRLFFKREAKRTEIEDYLGIYGWPKSDAPNI